MQATLESSTGVIIQSVQFSANNYNIAWGLLCERFDNTKLLIQNYLSALFNLEIIARKSSIALKGIIYQFKKITIFRLLLYIYYTSYISLAS